MFDNTYYESLLDGLTERASQRANDLSTDDAIFRTLIDDHVVPELMDPDVTRSIAHHTSVSIDDEAARTFAERYCEFDDSSPQQAYYAGRAFHALFEDVKQQLTTGAS